MIYNILLNRFAPHEVGRIDQEKLLRQVKSLRKFIALINSVSLEHLSKCDIADALDRIDADQIEQYSSVWTFLESSKEFIISGDKWLVVHTFVPCTAYLKTSKGTLRMDSIAKNNGLGYATFFPPQPENEHVLLSFNWQIKRDTLSLITHGMTMSDRKVMSFLKARDRGHYPIWRQQKDIAEIQDTKKN